MTTEATSKSSILSQLLRSKSDMNNFINRVRYKNLLSISQIQAYFGFIVGFFYLIIGFIFNKTLVPVALGVIIVAIEAAITFMWAKRSKERFENVVRFFLVSSFLSIVVIAFLFGTQYNGVLTLLWVLILSCLLGSTFVIALTGGGSAVVAIVMYLLDFSGNFKGILVLEGWLAQFFVIAVWVIMLSVVTFGLVVLINAFNTINLELRRETEKLAELNLNLENERNTSGEVAQQILGASSQIGTISQQQKAGMTEQLAAITEITSSIEELAAAASHIAGLAGQVLKAAQSSSDKADPIGKQAEQLIMIAEQGLEALQLSRQASRLVAERFIALDQRLTELANSSSELTSVATIIKNIADETHLLALNAAIEAAGAGESGQRFGVVAQEVKALADRTVESAEEVQTVLAKVSQLLVQASSDAQHGRLDAQQAAKQVVEAAQTISSLTDAVSQNAVNAIEIKDEVEAASVLAEQIDMATRQQRTASNQLVESMHQMQLVAQESAGGTTELTLAVTELERLSSRIAGQVN